ncbi:MAG: hypothetical protein AAFZ15_34590 [Bacteroidota bacterium]
MEKIDRYSTLLSLLAETSTNTEETRKAILISADARLIRIISEISLNILHGKLPITSYYKRKLSGEADTIRRLSSNQLKHTGKRKLCYLKANVIGLMLKSVLQHILALIESDPKFFFG